MQEETKIDTKVLFEFKQKNLILDDYFFQFLKDGIVIKGRIDRKTEEFLLYDEFISFSSKKINQNKLILKFKDENVGRRGNTTLVVPIDKNFKNQILDFLYKKLKKDDNPQSLINEKIFWSLFLILIIVSLIYVFLQYFNYFKSLQ